MSGSDLYDLCKRLARRLSIAEARQLEHLAAFIREIWSGACPAAGMARSHGYRAEGNYGESKASDQRRALG